MRNAGLISYIQAQFAAPCLGYANQDPYPTSGGSPPASSACALCYVAVRPVRASSCAALELGPLEESVMAEIVSVEDEPRVRRPLRPWLEVGQTLAQWLASLEDEPPPGEDMLPMIAPHAAAMQYSAGALEQRYRDQRVEVGFDMPVVFRLPDEHGLQVTGRLSPDVFVAFGVEHNPVRRDYDATVLKPPDFVLEVLSKSTWKRDAGPKLEAYALVGVRECFLFDPTGEQIPPPVVRGFALSEAGARPLPEVSLPSGSTGVYSKLLDLVAHVSATHSEGESRAHVLRWHDLRTGEDLRSFAEEAEARAAEAAARAAAEQKAAALERQNGELKALVRELRARSDT